MRYDPANPDDARVDTFFDWVRDRKVTKSGGVWDGENLSPW